jgi:hypothetical protein
MGPTDLALLLRAHEYLNLIHLQSGVMTLYWTG